MIRIRNATGWRILEAKIRYAASWPVLTIPLIFPTEDFSLLAAIL
jgi:hypothetical protein